MSESKLTLAPVGAADDPLPAFAEARPALRWQLVAAFVAAVAVTLPVRAAGLWLAGETASPEHRADVIAGVWVLKGALLLHAILIALVPTLRMPARDAAGLAPHAISRERSKFSRTEVILLLALCAVGLALRLPAVDRGLWIDEIEMYVKHVRLPLAQIVSTFDSQNQHLLYSILARTGLAAGLDPQFALRLPAVLFGVASLAAAVWFGSRITDRREAWVAAAVLAASYHHVWFSQNARGYTGLLFLTTVGSACFLMLLAEPGRNTKRWVVAYAVTMALAHLVHVTAAFATAAHGLTWLGLAFARRRSLQDRAWLTPFAALALAGTLSVLLYALVLPQFFETLLAPTNGGSAGMWKTPRWMIAETVRVLGAGVPGGIATVGIALGVVGVGVASYVGQSRALVSVMLLPLLCTAVVLLATSHNLWPRFFFFGAAFLVLIAIRGGFAIARRVMPRTGRLMATVGAVGVAVLSGFTVPRAWYPKQDFDGARAYVESNAVSGDGIAGVDMTGLVYTRYYDRPWTDLTSLDDLRTLEATHARTWVIVTFPSRLEVIQPALWQHLTRSYRTAATFPGSVGGGAIIVLVNR